MCVCVRACVRVCVIPLHQAHVTVSHVNMYVCLTVSLKQHILVMVYKGILSIVGQS